MLSLLDPRPSPDCERCEEPVRRCAVKVSRDRDSMRIGEFLGSLCPNVTATRLVLNAFRSGIRFDQSTD